MQKCAQWKINFVCKLIFINKKKYIYVHVYIKESIKNYCKIITKSIVTFSILIFNVSYSFPSCALN